MRAGCAESILGCWTRFLLDAAARRPLLLFHLSPIPSSLPSLIPYSPSSSFFLISAPQQSVLLTLFTIPEENCSRERLSPPQPVASHRPDTLLLSLSPAPSLACPSLTPPFLP